MPKIPIATMSFPTRMLVGPGAAAQLGEEAKRLGAIRVLLVSDPGLRDAGVVEEVSAHLLRSGIGIGTFLNPAKNPGENDVRNGLEAYQAHGANAIVALGGGAVLDVAKAIQMVVNHPLPLSQYDEENNGWERVTNELPPLIAIPTTAGTGSEVGRAAVICIGENNRKAILYAPNLMPSVAILDASLTCSLPKFLTAATGVDALTHSLEAYAAKGEHPFADMFALQALTRIGKYLVRAVEDGKDIVARHNMLLASTQGAIAFQKGLGLCHALAHPLSAVAGLHHGLANAIMLPRVVRFNRPTVAARYQVAAKALGVQARSPELRARALDEYLERLNDQLGIPNDLSQQGVEESQVEEMSRQALADAALASNPVSATEEQIQALYRDALSA